MRKFIAGLLLALAFVLPAQAQQSINVHKATIGTLVYDSTAGNVAGGCTALSGTFPKQTITGAAGVDARTTTSEAIADSDRCKLVTFSNGSAVAATIAQAGSGGNFAAGWLAHVVNLGAGTVTLTPTTSTINGASSLALATGQGADIYSNGANYFAQVGKSSGAGSGDVVGPGSAVDNNCVAFDGTTGKLIKDAGAACGGTGSPGGSNGQLQYNNSGSFGGLTQAAHQVPVATSTSATTFKTVPDCTDTGGNHLNYTQSGDTFSCGTSGGGGGGDFVKISCQTASASAELDFTSVFTSTYDNYALEIVGLVPTGNNHVLEFQFGNAAGPTWETSANYYWAQSLAENGGGNSNPNVNADTSSGVFFAWSNTAGRAGNASLRITNPLSTSVNKDFSGTGKYSNQTNIVGGNMWGELLIAGTAYNSFRLLMSGGDTMASGRVCLYGLAH